MSSLFMEIKEHQENRSAMDAEIIRVKFEA